MVHLSSILVVALSLGAGVWAHPAKPTSTPAATDGPKNATIQDLQAHPIQFPPVSPSVKPIPGAPTNTTLLAVVPKLQEIVTNGTTKHPALAVRDENLDKRFECDNVFAPWAYDWMWDFYADNFCDFYFPGQGTYYVAAGFCFTGNVPANGGWPKLDFTYCAKNPNVPYPIFVAITNSICKAEFEGIVLHDDTYWTCPAYKNGAWAYKIHGGDNFDVVGDSSTWQLKAI